MWIAKNWKDYEVLDTSAGEKLERWGKYILVRPDPQVIWNTPHDHEGWRRKNGHYHRSVKGGGEWEFFDLPDVKYARMMASTAPEEYEQFADKLPAISAEKQEIMEQIIELQVKWMEEFAAQYPKLAGNARTIHTAEDLPYDTSYETYLRGELGTYSDKMLEMYGRYIVEHAKNAKNVAREIMANTIKFYGYKSFEEAESKEVLGQ